jgi:DNA-binding response OmpR family regulator
MNTPSSGFRGDPVPIPIKDAARPVRRILVVEDDHDIRQFCAEALVRSGYRLDCAEDGAAGWQALQANGYNLLVTDNDLPKFSGVELVKKLRAAGMDLAVVLASGSIPAEDIARNPSLQLAATLQKPFSLGELVETVEKVLSTVDSTRDRPIIPFPATAAPPRELTRASP